MSSVTYPDTVLDPGSQAPELSHKRQPKALKFLFFAELWERFSFYGLQSILILYLTSEFAMLRDAAYMIIGVYGALVYGLSILGGYIADNFLGMRRSIILGGGMIIAGHVTLAIPVDASLYYGLSFIVVGTGFFKANVSSFLGEFYQQSDPRRDTGFTLFYMGINIGSLFAMLLMGVTTELYGWHVSFSLAAVGMAVGLFVFIRGFPTYEGKGLPAQVDVIDRPLFMGMSLQHLIIIGALLLVPMIVLVIKNAEAVKMYIPFIGVIAFCFILLEAYRSGPEDRKRVLALLMMFFFVACFFAMFKQLVGSMQLFAEESVDRDVLLPTWIVSLFGLADVHFKIPSPWIMGLNSAFIIILSPIFAYVWRKLRQLNIVLAAPTKIAIGILLTSFGFYIFSIAIHAAGSDYKAGLLFVFCGYLVFTMGEVLVTPVSLATVTKLAPERVKSLMMGFYAFSVSSAVYISGVIATHFAPVTPRGQNGDVLPQELLSSFDETFTFLTYYGIVVVAVLLILTPFVKHVFNRYE